MVKYLLHCILTLIYPDRYTCLICNQYSLNNCICRECNKKLEIINQDFRMKSGNESYRCFSVFKYSGEVTDIIKKLKYGNKFSLVPFLGEYMTELIRSKNIDFDIITFVPMTSRRKKHRGFNQAQLLAEEVGKRINKPVDKILKKEKNTKDQIGLNDEERWKNVSKCFQLNGNVDVKDKVILLIDDVITTGATTINCGEILKKHGAKEIYILTVAKSIV